MRLVKFFVLFAVFVFSYCSSEKPTQIKQEKKINIPYVLNPESIYLPDSILLATEKATSAQKSESRKLFMQGLDLLVNKNNPAASIEFFKESILYYPDEKNYMYLFKAYVNTSDVNNAESVNQILEKLIEDWKIDYFELSYNRALISAVDKDTNACIGNLSEAVMEGFMFKDRITNEKLFSFMSDYLPFQSFVASNFGSDEKLNRLLFKAFLKVYPDLNLPYAINYDSVGYFDYDKYIDYNFAVLIPGMNDDRFSRDVTNEYMYVGKTKLEGGYAFIYKSYMTIADTLNPVKTYVVTYDTAGKMIENELIGCFCSPSESKAFVINKDLSITIIDYKTNWQFDPLEKGYAGNSITSTDEEKKTLITIDKSGVLKREEIAAIKPAENSGG